MSAVLSVLAHCTNRLPHSKLNGPPQPITNRQRRDPKVDFPVFPSTRVAGQPSSRDSSLLGATAAATAAATATATAATAAAEMQLTS